MKKCVRKVGAKGEFEKSDLATGLLIYPVLLAIVFWAISPKAAIIIISVLLLTVVIFFTNLKGEGHSTKCSLRAGMAKMLGLAGFISPSV